MKGTGMIKPIMTFLVCLLVFPIQSYSEKSSTPESLGRELISIWQNGNIEDLGAIVSENAEYEAAQQNYTYKGLEKFKSYVGHASKFAKDLELKITSINSTQSTAAIEWIMTGIQDRPIPGRITIATNKEFTVKGVTLIKVEDGLITKATDYLDVLGFVLQLGARVELPGGVVLEMK